MDEQYLQINNVPSMLSCDDCGELLQSVQQLYDHRRNHFVHYAHFCLPHLNKLNYCPFCSFKFEYHEKEDFDELEIVKIDKKLNRTSFKCSMWSTETQDVASLTDHYKYDYLMNFPHIPLMETSNGESELKCNICLKRFLNSCCLSNHKSIHIPKAISNKPDLTLFKCDVCPKEFLTNVMALDHQFAHSNERHFRCFMCRCDFKFMSTLRNHIIMHAQRYGKDSLSCEFCSKMFISPSGLKFHINQVHAKEIRITIYTCDICDEHFISKSDYDNHMIKTIHDGEAKFQCDDDCNMNFKFRKLILKHLIRSHLDLYGCMYCFKKFNTMYALGLHINLIHKCIYCPNTSMTAKKLNLHTRQHFKDNPPKLCCCYCNTECKTKNEYFSHMKGGHLFQCNACPEKFSIEAHFISHSYAHIRTKEIDCKLCSNYFYENELFIKHMKEAHNDIIITEPLITTKKNHTKKTLNNVDVVNNNNKQLLIFSNHPNGAGLYCKMCKKKFRVFLKLQKHVLKNHLKLKKDYFCQICNKYFKTRGGSKTHMRSHERMKLNLFYYCEICSKEFSSAQGLKEHSVKHTGIKPYICQYCGKCFATSGVTYRHEKICKGC